MDAVVAGESGQPEIGDDEPLRRQRVEIIVEVLGFLRLRHHHIDAGFELTDRLIDRKRGGDVGIERRRLDRKLALPHRDRARPAQPIDLVAAETALEIATAVVVAANGVGNAAIAEPVNLDGDGARIGADHRDAALPGARQHIGGGGKARERLAVADVDGEVRGLRQRLVHGRRQSGAQGDLVGLAVLQALDAELFLGRGQRRLVGAREHDKRRKVGARRQVLGELEAGAWRRGIGIDAVVEHAEAVLLAQPLILTAHVG